ncbi:hypothetical protein ABH935_008362 [Catenulispora sp. GAS73]|uniref:acyl-CoA carboxylase epsilon subunit n=1 Tax=Catenulispora sp. GAS73 TaxID=3156269 RepID=UPI0035137B20
MPEPYFTVVRGRLDPFETAAVTVVLAALARRSRSGPPSASGASGAGGPWRPSSAGYEPPSSWRGRR